MPVALDTTLPDRTETHLPVDLMIDRSQGSALLAPLTSDGERFLSSVHGLHGAWRAWGAVFIKRALADDLVDLALSQGLRLRLDNRVIGGRHD